MKQKIGIARAMINDPKILFLDEPTSGLDPGIAREVLKLILRLKEERKTILMTTHLLARAEQVCDSIALINKGKILRTGKVYELVDFGYDKILNNFNNLNLATVKTMK